MGQPQQHAATSGDTAEPIEIRVVTDAELGAWGQALNVGFMRGRGDGSADWHRERFELGRALGAFDGERCVGTFRSFAKELTVPGGATAVADAVTNVTVSASHRRRGLLNRMMRQDLDAAVARGEAFAMLIAAEFGIYGRYGFGPASDEQGKVVDKRVARGIRVPAASETGSIELLTMEEYRKIGPELHDRFRRTQPGAVSRDDFTWQVATGKAVGPGRSFNEPLVALYRDADGTPAGVLVYEVTDEWRNWLPKDVTLKVKDCFAVDWPAEAALWRYALEVDWIQRIDIPRLAPDSPLPLALLDQRACVDNHDSCGDFLWVRILDVAQAFSLRRYPTPGRVVFDVADAMGYTPGRFVLEVAEDGTGRCVADPSARDEEVDFALDVSQLAAVYFGHQPLVRLAAAGLAQERRPGALRAAQRVLDTERAPWCLDVF